MQFHLIKEIKEIFYRMCFITLGIITFIAFLEMKFFADSLKSTLFHVVTISIVIILYVLYKRFNKTKNKIQNKYYKPITISLYSKAFIVFIAIFIQTMIESHFSSDTANQRLIEKNDEGLSMATVFVGGSLTAPIIEEIIFRGVLFITILSASSYLQNKIKTRNDKLGVISFFIISSVLFGFMHVAKAHDIENIGGYLVSGIVLSLVFIFTRDIKTVIAIHMLGNTLSILGRYDYMGIVYLVGIIMIIYIFIFAIIFQFSKSKVIDDYGDYWKYKFKKYRAKKKINYQKDMLKTTFK